MDLITEFFSYSYTISRFCRISTLSSTCDRKIIAPDRIRIIPSTRVIISSCIDFIVPKDRAFRMSRKFFIKYF